MRRTVWIVIVGAALLFPAAAAEPNKAPEKKDAPAKRKVEAGDPEKPPVDANAPVVFDNETLSARYGEGRGPVSVVSGGVTGPAAADALEPAEPLPDALQAIEDDKARQRTRQITLQQLDVEIGRLEAKIAGLEKRNLATRNPFLPRPVIPEDEALEWSQLTASQRVARADEMIADTRRELDAARGRRERLTATH